MGKATPGFALEGWLQRAHNLRQGVAPGLGKLQPEVKELCIVLL